MSNGIQFLFGFHDTSSFLFVNVTRRLEHGLRDFERIAAFNRPEETGFVTLVTSRADLLDLDQQRVAVAIEREILNRLRMTAFLTLHPEFLPGPAPEMGFAGGDGFFQRGAIHPRHHQYAPGARFLHNGWNQPVGVEFQFVVKAHFLRHSLIANPRN